MESRTEPRFKTHSSALVEVIREKAYTFQATVTEVSGIGLRIEMPEALNAGENIRVTVDGYHLFAQVRRCLASEAGFIIGVERVDGWEKRAAETALEGAKMSAAMSRPLPVLGRPKLKNPLGSLQSAALRNLFSDPRLRTTQGSYGGILVFAACMALAGVAGWGGWEALRHKPHSAALVNVESESLPVNPKPAETATPKPTVTSNISSGLKSSGEIVAPSKPNERAEAPSDPKGLHSAAPGTTISIKASAASWITACADGARVMDMLVDKGFEGEVHFTRKATARFGNAGAIELSFGSEASAILGPAGEARAIRATPTGYKLITVPSALNCDNR